MSLGVQLVLVLATAAVFMALAGWLGRSWWLAGAPALVLAATLFVLAQPLVIDPLFNRFEPLEDRALAAKIEALGRQEGVTVSSVEVADASRRTTAANAYVGGIGPTRRVVLYDTLLDGRFSQPEVVSVSAHELAHVDAAISGKASAGSPSSPFHACSSSLGLPSGGGLAALEPCRSRSQSPSASSFWTMPFANAVSRRFEAEADWIALRSTRDPASFVSLERARPLRPRRSRSAPLGISLVRHASAAHAAHRDGATVQRSVSGRFLIPSRAVHFDQLSFIASMSSRMKRGDMFTRLTTTPGTSPSSTSWSMRAKVTVNS